MLTPMGAKAIETFRVGDEIISKPDWDADGAVRVQTVEEVFRLQAPILKLGIGGQTIETTAEHPFYVNGKGWDGRLRFTYRRPTHQQRRHIDAGRISDLYRRDQTGL